MRATERTFSEFLRQPNDVIDELADHDVVLRRRAGPALKLSQLDREEGRVEAFGALARLLRNLALHAPVAIHNGVRDAFPWVQFLPDTEREDFVRELTLTLAASADIENFAPVRQLLLEWRATAEIFADPKLAARLREPIDGTGDHVVPPEA